MATKRLGKGLEALIRSNTFEDSGDSKGLGISNILIAKIKTNPLQPRKDFRKDLLEDLASSIKENGVISPITVRDLVAIGSFGCGTYHLFIHVFVTW